jgi:hypothetical protein
VLGRGGIEGLARPGDPGELEGGHSWGGVRISKVGGLMEKGVYM